VPSLGRPVESIGVPAAGLGDVPYLDVVAIHDAAKNAVTLLILNRDLEKSQTLDINWHDLSPTKVMAFETITGPDLKVINTFADPTKVVPQKLETPKVGSRMSVQLPAKSYSVLSLAL
jgi:alpha-L-arabinofuranosidase